MPLDPKIVREIERVPSADIASLVGLGVATIHESYARTGLMHDIHPIVAGLSMGGNAVTCLNYAGDNLMLHAALDVAQPGDVIVVGVTTPSAHGMFGELLATGLRAKGVAGIVVDAGVRDVPALREMRFPVWARHVSAAGTVKNSPGWVNVPICCGGQIVCPGDAVIADDDGVVVVARMDVPVVVARAQARAASEDVTRNRVAEGASALDKGGRREMLAPYVEGRESR